MSIFRRPDYQSDATQFINQLKASRPELDQQQQAGRALLWDKQVDRKIASVLSATPRCRKSPMSTKPKANKRQIDLKP